MHVPVQLYRFATQIVYLYLNEYLFFLLKSKMLPDECLRRKWFLPSSPMVKLALLTSDPNASDVELPAL